MKTVDASLHVWLSERLDTRSHRGRPVGLDFFIIFIKHLATQRRKKSNCRRIKPACPLIHHTAGVTGMYVLTAHAGWKLGAGFSVVCYRASCVWARWRRNILGGASELETVCKSWMMSRRMTASSRSRFFFFSFTSSFTCFFHLSLSPYISSHDTGPQTEMCTNWDQDTRCTPRLQAQIN